METKGSEPGVSQDWGPEWFQWKYRGPFSARCVGGFTPVHRTTPTPSLLLELLFPIEPPRWWQIANNKFQYIRPQGISNQHRIPRAGFLTDVSSTDFLEALWSGRKRKAGVGGSEPQDICLATSNYPKRIVLVEPMVRVDCSELSGEVKLALAEAISERLGGEGVALLDGGYVVIDRCPAQRWESHNSSPSRVRTF